MLLFLLLSCRRLLLGRRRFTAPCGFLSDAFPPSAPSAPLIETLLTSNSTFAQLRLNSWTEHQCPITYFVVQYKIHALPDWIMVSNNIIPEQGQIIVSDLIPATWYDIAMTAYSDAGPAEAQYRFATLTLDGGTPRHS